MKSSIAALPLMAALASAVSGCAGQDPHPAPAKVPQAVVEQVNGTLLASIDLEAGHGVRFYEVQPGLVVATEFASYKTQTPVMGNRKIDSYVDLFKSLAPDRAVPAALVAAEAQRQAPLAVAPSPPPPDVAAASTGAGPSFYTAAEQQAFKDNDCHPLPVPFSVPKCIQGWDWIDSGWDHTTDWKSTVFVGSEGTTVAQHDSSWWKCDNGSCAWAPLGHASVPPGQGYWLSAGGNGNWYYLKATLNGAGANTQVSMAIEDGPYTCVHCNDGSCQCGYDVPDNLCGAHGGADFSVGCTIQN